MDLAFLDREVSTPKPLGIGEHQGRAYYWALVPHPYLDNRWTNAVVTNERELFVDERVKGKPPEADKIRREFGLYYDYPKIHGAFIDGWKPTGVFSVKDFLSGKTSELKDAFERLFDLNQRYVEHTSDYYHYLVVLKVLETYFYPIFDAIGKVHIQGEYASGKTQQTKVFQFYAFNPIGVSVSTEAGLRRILHSIGGTLILDDQDDLPEDIAVFIRRLIRVGYKKGMSKALLTRIGGKGEVEMFDLFFPLVSNSISELDVVSSSREFVIYMRRSVRHIPPLSQKDQELHNQLYCTGLCSWFQVKETYAKTSLPESMPLRLKEISAPVIALLSLVKPEVVKDFTAFLMEDYEERRRLHEEEDELFNALRVFLDEMFDPHDQIDIFPSEMAIRMVQGEDITAQRERRRVESLLGRRFKANPLFFKRVIVNNRVAYRTTPTRLLEFIQRRGWDKWLDVSKLERYAATIAGEIERAQLKEDENREFVDPVELHGW